MTNTLFRLFLSYVVLLSSRTLTASDTIPRVPLPDSVKVISVLHSFHKKGRTPYEWKTGIESGVLSFHYSSKGKKEMLTVKAVGDGRFQSGTVGIGVKAAKNKLTFRPRQALPDSMTLYITSARDSASQIQLYSCYLYFPDKQQWKLLGTWHRPGRGQYITGLQILSGAPVEVPTTGGLITGSWYQNNTGKWNELRAPLQKIPALMPFANIDSAAQAEREGKKLAKWPGRNAWQEKEGIFYEIINPGKGEAVKVSDTVTVRYKGYLLETGEVFDQTTDEPRSFPLNRLIKGWQIGLPLIQTGGKIKLILPSGIAYGIRTRSAKIPPNGVLVFEIEIIKKSS